MRDGLKRLATSVDVRARGERGVQSDFSVRGAGFGQMLVLVDGVRLNDAPVADEAASVTAADLRDGAAKLSLGRKRHLLVRPA